MRNEILKLLETDSRLTVKDIAAMIGADEATVEADIKAMEDESIICGYHTMIDWDKVGEEMVTAMIEVKVTPQREAGFDQIADRVRNFDEVHSVYLIAGAYDFMVCLLYTSDAADEEDSVDLGGCRIIKKKTKERNGRRTSIISDI